MADESSAADEYAFLQEVPAPLTTLPDDPVAIDGEELFKLADRVLARRVEQDEVPITRSTVYRAISRSRSRVTT